MKALFGLVLSFAFITAIANDNGGPWKQAELTEEYMKALTKQQCMAKTIASLKTDCKSDACLKTLAGISGDCTTWGQGDYQEFCNSFDAAYLKRYCWSNDLDARSCMFLNIGKAVNCKQK